jgi:hypothetical protein
VADHDQGAIDATPDGITLTDWLSAKNIGRTAGFALLKIAKGRGFEPVMLRRAGVSKASPFLSGRVLEAMDALAAEHQGGQSIKTLEAKYSGEAMAIARRQTVKVDQAESAMALVAAMAAKLTPPADPLQQARRLKEAADLGLWLSNAEMAEVIGMAESTLRDKGHDYSPRPGFRLERKQDSSRRFTRSGVIWWRAVQEGAAPSAVTSPVTSRPVGFAGAIEARCQTISAAIELPRLPFG